jgi:hypothetical protein
MTSIDICGRRFRHASEPDAGPAGFWDHHQDGVLLMDRDRKPFAYVVNNRQGERFFVSCSQNDDGKVWFMHGLDERAAARLGLPDSYLGRLDVARTVIDDVRTTSAVLLRREVREGAASWSTAYETRHLPVRASAFAPLLEAINHAIRPAGIVISHTPTPGLTTLGPTRPECLVESDENTRLTLVYLQNSHPAFRYHGDVAAWPASRLDRMAKDWLAEPTGPDQEPRCRAHAPDPDADAADQPRPDCGPRC